jgi:bifunctional non-homologous end joining protein LigD
MVWDFGKYESPEDRPPEEQLACGKIHVVLQGENLRGAFTLIKLVLIKSRDEYADVSWDIESPRFDYSVLTGRTLEEIRD